MNPTLGRITRVGAAMAVLASSWLIAGSPAASAAPAPAQAVIRAAHFSPTTPGVDVYLTPFAGGGTKTAWLSGVSYGAVSGYQSLTPGLYTVAMRLAGASPSTPPALSWVLDAKAGAAYTIAGVGAGSSVRGVVIPDDLSAPPAGDGLVRVIQAASRAPVVSVADASGSVIAPSAQFASVTSYASVAAGSLDIKATSTSDPSITTDSTVDIKSGQITSILLLDGKSGGITLRTLVDSASAGLVPVGAVPAGAGGAATSYLDVADSAPGGRSLALTVGLPLAGLLMLGVGVGVLRRAGRRDARHAAS
jgi:hypothetical protein